MCRLVSNFSFITIFLQYFHFSITLGEGQNTGVGWLNAAMNEGRPYTYLIPKNGTRRIREIMDFALLTVYSEEKVSDDRVWKKHFVFKVENFLITRNLPIKMLIATERRKSRPDTKTNSNSFL